jgi:hypothetical protein
MKSLEACYELNFNKINFIERKIRITHPKSIIKGASRVGKSYLIYDFLSHFKTKEYIYIDFNDIRNDKNEIASNLNSFLRTNQIKVLVLENFDFDFEIPYCDNIIITTKIEKKLRGFKNIEVLPLDFEEYLLHDNKHQNPIQSFNFFLKYGNLPEVINIDEHKKILRIQKLLKLQCEDSTREEVLKILCENIDEKKSLLQLFNKLKEKIKISKDKFYETAKNYENSKTIYFLEKYNQKKSTKKIYSYNHAFLNALTHNKKFKNEFTNMVFLELHGKYSELYYLDNIDFYIKSKNLAIVAIPFFNTFLMNNILKKIYKTALEFKIKQIEIITISNEETIKHKELKISVTPFYEWSLS